MPSCCYIGLTTIGFIKKALAVTKIQHHAKAQHIEYAQIKAVSMMRASLSQLTIASIRDDNI